ncbi:N-acetylglucosamine-6-phosphate deacetylase [Neobacillus sp. SM06]|uniref:N-acetylglucosamine-6-phosphate deacetylase n=1 Tax=Neobacillus sp. SM06 TaxID=3422492 RepID=UPI003D2CADE4
MTLKAGALLLKGMSIFTEEETIETGYIKINNHRIIEIGSVDQLTEMNGFEVINVPADYTAVPGFIDVHIHGVNGADVMDATPEALNTMAMTLPKEGTTSFLATTITQNEEAIERALKNASHYIISQRTAGTAEVLGIHLEGPFVNPKRAGAQPVQYIVDPNLEQFQQWQSMANDQIKLVTLAPEQPGGLELVRYLKRYGIIASIGHSDATFAEVMAAIDAGVNHVTHLFNQMRGLHHREPGVVGAAFLKEEVKAELIADGVHVRPEMVELAFKLKRKDGLILITDSMRAKCLKNGHYDLGGQDVTVQNGKAVLEDGTLAGSILRLGDAVKNLQAFAGCSLKDAIEMASVNPAKQLNLYDRKGSLSVGKDADIVLLNQESEVCMTFCRGKLAFKREE